ncbi:MAG: hypothetical protein ACAF41_28115 [Leptolyngbya sp. BL-A-14]
MPVLKLRVSSLLLACAMTGLIAATLPYPGLPSLSQLLEQAVQELGHGLH